MRLREKQIEDAWRDYSWRKDRELADYDATRPITMTFRAYTATITEDLRRPSKFRRTFAIEDRESGRHIGNVMYYGYDSYLGEAELGITIGERAYWSRGYGSEAVRCLLGHLFTRAGAAPCLPAHADHQHPRPTRLPARRLPPPPLRPARRLRLRADGDQPRGVRAAGARRL